MNYLPNDITSSAPAMPSNRYVLPSFEERTPYGYKRQDPYAKLFEDRIIFLGTQVDDASADDIMAQLLVLEAQDPERDITLYINSPGGSFTAMTAIYDTMQLIPNDVVTVVTGMAASMGQFLLTAGTIGKRYATPNARILMHQPLGGIGGTASDIRTQAELILDMKKRLAEITAERTGKSLETILKDNDRDNWFNAEGGLEYGFFDHIATTAGKLPESKNASGRCT